MISQLGQAQLGQAQLGSVGATSADISPSGLVSAFAAGTPLIAGGNQTVSPAGLPSRLNIGVPRITGNRLQPTGLASAFAAGTPFVNGVTNIGVTGLPSALAIGTLSVHQLTATIQPAGLASAFVAGTPAIVAGNQRILGAGGLGPGLAGTPTLIGGTNRLQIWIGNINRTAYLSVVEATTIQSQTIGRSSANFAFWVNDASWIPRASQTVIITEYGRKLFMGCLSEVVTDRQMMTESLIRFTCTATDKAAILDHRIVYAEYEVDTSVVSVVADIMARFLNGEGITAGGVPVSMGSLTSKLSFNFVTVTQAFDAIKDLTGYQWWLDFNGVLNWRLISDAPAAPITLDETSDNWRNLTVTESLIDYRNKQYVVSNLAASPAVAGAGGPNLYRTETYTLPQAAAAAAALVLGAIVLNFPAQDIISLEVQTGGVGPFVEQPVYDGINDSYNFRHAWWAFPSSQYLTPPNSGNNTPSQPDPPVTSADPSIGDVVRIKYIPNFRNANVDQDAALSATCGSGTFEAVEQVQDISDSADLKAIARGLLSRSGTVPQKLMFETDYPGFEVGQLLSVDIPAVGLGTTDLFVTGVSGQSLATDLGHSSSFRWDITAITTQDPGNWVKWFERLIKRTQQPRPLQVTDAASFALAPGGSLAGGASVSSPNISTVSGKVFAVYGAFATPPVDQDLYIDILVNNISIFGGLQANMLKIPAGSTANTLQSVETFPKDFFVYVGDIITIDATYRTTGGAPVAAKSGTVRLVTQYAGTNPSIS